MKPVNLFSGHCRAKKGTNTQECVMLAFVPDAKWVGMRREHLHFFPLPYFWASSLRKYFSQKCIGSLYHKYRLAKSQPHKIPHVMIF